MEMKNGYEIRTKFMLVIIECVLCAWKFEEEMVVEEFVVQKLVDVEWMVILHALALCTFSELPV